jgi:hypothetical protein
MEKRTDWRWVPTIMCAYIRDFSRRAEDPQEVIRVEGRAEERHALAEKIAMLLNREDAAREGQDRVDLANMQVRAEVLSRFRERCAQEAEAADLRPQADMSTGATATEAGRLIREIDLDRWLADGMPDRPAALKSCIVSGCPNRVGEGTFVGPLCKPCHEMIVSGVVGPGKTFVHRLVERLAEAHEIERRSACGATARVLRSGTEVAMKGMIGLEMKVTCECQKVLAALKVNRVRHVEMYKAARAGYVARVKDALRATLSLWEKGEMPPLIFDLRPPVSHEREYDTVIEMLTLHTGGTIDLSADEVRMFVQDQWDWTEAFLATSSAYSAMARDRLAG